MKLCTVNAVNNVGSTGCIAASLCRAVERAGGESLFLYGRGGAVKDVPSYRVGDDRALYLHAALSRVTDRQGFYAKAATACAVERIQAFDPDVIHLHNVHGYYLHLPTLFSYLTLCGKPVVWTLHDCFPMTGHCAHFSPAECERWRTGCHDCPRKTVYPASYLFDASRRNYAEKKALFTALPNLTLAAPCRWMQDVVRQSYLGKYPVELVYNGVDLAAFSPDGRAADAEAFRAAHGLGGKRIALGVASPWNREKGFDDFLCLAEMLPPDWRVVLLGVDARKIAALPARVLGLPRVNGQKALAAAYRAADVYVNASYCETFPLTNLESLASGTPVATYAAGGSPEAVDGASGVAVPVGNLPALCDAILAASAFSPAPCRARAESFPFERMISEYLGLYDRLLGRNGG